MTTFGYCRISTPKQNIERQVSNITSQYPDAVIIKEAYTGTTTDRPAWNKLMSRVKPGDTIVFDEVSRMSRNAEEGFQLYQELFLSGVRLAFIKERHIDTDVYQESLNTNIPTTGNDIDIILNAVKEYLMIVAKRQIELAFTTAQKEVDFLHKRTKEGVAEAKKRYMEEELMGIEHQKNLPGRQQGSKIQTKKSIEMKAKIQKMSQVFEGTMKDADIIDILGINRHTYYKYKKELLEATK